MQNRLHDAIKSHQSLHTIRSYITDNKNLNVENKQGETALHLAAREGMLQVVLHLLNANVPIDAKSLYLAVERGHVMIAKILLACGADKQQAENHARELSEINIAEKISSLTLDINIVRSLLAWQIHNSSSSNFNLFSRIQPCLVVSTPPNIFPEVKIDIDLTSNKNPHETKIEIHSHEEHKQESIRKLLQKDFSGLIELSAFYSLKETVIELMKLGTVRAEPHIPTAGYLSRSWTAQVNSKSEIYNMVCEKQNVLVTSLWQIRTHANDTYHFRLLADQCQAAIQEQVDDMSYQPPAPILSRNQHLAYQAASFGFSDFDNEKELTRYCKTEDEYYSLVIQAFNDRNFFALKNLFQFKKDHSALLEKLLQENKTDIIFYWLINSENDIYELFLNYRSHKNLLNSLLTHCWSIEGLLQCILSRGISLDSVPTPEMHELYNNIHNKLTATSIHCLQLCIQDRYHETNENKIDATPFFKRFRLPFANKQSFEGFESLPDPLLKLVIQYLDEREQKKLLSWKQNQHIRDCILYAKESPEWIRENKIHSLNLQLNLLNKFITAAEKDLKNKGICSNRLENWKLSPHTVSILTTVLAAGLLGVGGMGVGYFAENISSGYQRLNQTMNLLNNHTCSEDYNPEMAICYKPKPPFYELCVYLCEDVSTTQLRQIFLIAGMFFGGMGALYPLFYSVFYLYSCLSKGRERFNDIPLTKFSLNTQDAARLLIEESKYQDNVDNLQLNLDMHMGILLSSAKSTRDRVTNELKNLNAVITEKKSAIDECVDHEDSNHNNRDEQSNDYKDEDVTYVNSAQRKSSWSISRFFKRKPSGLQHALLDEQDIPSAVVREEFSIQ